MALLGLCYCVSFLYDNFRVLLVLFVVCSHLCGLACLACCEFDRPDFYHHSSFNLVFLNPLSTLCVVGYLPCKIQVPSAENPMLPEVLSFSRDNVGVIPIHVSGVLFLVHVASVEINRVFFSPETASCIEHMYKIS